MSVSIPPRFYFGDGAAFYIGASRNRQVVTHQAIALILALDRPFEISADALPGDTAHAVLLPTLVAHRFNDRGARHFFLFFDADSAVGLQLVDRYGGRFVFDDRSGGLDSSTGVGVALGVR